MWARSIINTECPDFQIKIKGCPIYWSEAI